MPSAVVASGAAVGPFVAIGPGVQIGEGARIASHVSIAEGARIGPHCLLHAGARIGRNVRIGARFIAHSGCVIGADGFSFVTPEKSKAEAVRETLGDASEAKSQPWLAEISWVGFRYVAHLMPVMPWCFEQTPDHPVRHSPCFGQDSAAVFEKELGISADEYAELVALGVTGTERRT